MPVGRGGVSNYNITDPTPAPFPSRARLPVAFPLEEGRGMATSRLRALSALCVLRASRASHVLRALRARRAGSFLYLANTAAFHNAAI